MTLEALFDKRRRFYERRLPSGGYVAIEAERVPTLFGGMKIRGEVIVERRSEPRRRGHRAPIAVCAEHAQVDDTVHALLPFARSDLALADVLGRKVTALLTAGRTTMH